VNNVGLNTIINRDSIFQKHQVLSSYSKLFPLAIPNVPLNPNPVSGNLNSLNALKSSYMQAITGMKSSLLSAVNEIFVGFSDVLELTNSFKTSLLTEISKLDNPEFSNHFQYRYNCAKDVCKTYNELYDLMLLLRSECCPDITAFPKHLILGKASNNGHLDANRHDFYPAPTNTSFESYLNQAKSLIIKMDLLLVQIGHHLQMYIYMLKTLLAVLGILFKELIELVTEPLPLSIYLRDLILFNLTV
jgi:hypothetical protein